jgi:hypothetical protein
VSHKITWPISIFRHATIRLCQDLNKERFVAGIGQEEGIVLFVTAYDSVCSARYKKFIAAISIHSALRPHGVATHTHTHTTSLLLQACSSPSPGCELASGSTDCSSDASSRTQIITHGHFLSSVAFVHFSWRNGCRIVHCCFRCIATRSESMRKGLKTSFVAFC